MTALSAASPRDARMDTPKTALGGLLRRKEVWALSWRGWLLGALLGAAAFFLFVFQVNPFLAVTDRPKPQVLVIEGWTPDYALLAGWKEFQRGGYSTVLTVGAPFLSGVSLDPGDDYAHDAAKRLRRLIGPNLPIVPVPSLHVRRDRTYSCAVAAKEWLEANHSPFQSVTVVTLGVHARRSRLLFQKAFGRDTTVGVISVADEEYDPTHWWRYSEGVKEIIAEGAGYLYARFFFHP